MRAVFRASGAERKGRAEPPGAARSEPASEHGEDGEHGAEALAGAALVSGGASRILAVPPACSKKRPGGPPRSRGGAGATCLLWPWPSAKRKGARRLADVSAWWIEVAVALAPLWARARRCGR